MARQQLILDRYRVIDQVGAGGYGTVQHAYDTRLKRDVAIKRIALSEVDVARARLLAMEERMRVEGALAEEEDLSCAQDTASAFGEELSTKRRTAANSAAEPESGDAAVASSPTRVVDIVRAEPLPWEDDADFPEDPAFLDAREGAFRPLSPLGSMKSPSRSALRKSEEKPARAMPAASGATAEAEVADIDDDALFDHIPGLEEARTAAHLNDANIVTVYDCEVHGDAAYVVMEYVEGKTLSRVLRELGDDISLDVIAAVFASVSPCARGRPRQRRAASRHQARKRHHQQEGRGQGYRLRACHVDGRERMRHHRRRHHRIHAPPSKCARRGLTCAPTNGRSPASLTRCCRVPTRFSPTTSRRRSPSSRRRSSSCPRFAGTRFPLTPTTSSSMRSTPILTERFESVAAFAAELTPLLGNARAGKEGPRRVGERRGGRGAAEEPREPRPPLIDRIGPAWRRRVPDASWPWLRAR